MSNPKDIGKAVATTVNPPTIRDLVKGAAKELGNALPSHMKPERIVRIALTAINLNPELAKCTPSSFMGSLFVLAQLGLEPIAGRAYLLPFKNKRKIGDQWQTVPEVQAIIGYKGLVDLFYRHESALSIDMQTVYENDEFSYEYGTTSFLKHVPALKDRGAVKGYYAVAKMKGGASIFRFMSKEDAVAHGKKHSKSFDRTKDDFVDFSPWKKEFDAMCMKTVLIQLAKLLPLSIELQRAISIDETSRDFRKGIGDTFDMPATTNFNDEPEPEEPKPLTDEQMKAEFAPEKK